ncbi:MAG: ATP-binding protein, partial [Planctomycetota bacterium]
QGTGLGLSIVSRIMERFGGGVHLESEEGSYTRVTVLLPAKSAPRDRRENREPSDVESINTTG